MPVLKASDALPERPVIVFIYGEPGVGKTSLFNTSNNPLLIDFDRGKDRAIFRKDTLVVNTWEDVEVEEKEGTFKNYGTIGIDTAKACLDDFLMSYVVKKDFKNAKNKLAAYGSIGDEFKIFVSNRRSEAADIVIIAHSKDDKDGETIRKIPDVTGGSFQLLLRIADQVGYMSMKNNKRTIQFEPTDQTIGKNVARLPLIEVPADNDLAIKNFLGVIVEKVRKSITAQSEAQREALEKSDRLQREISKAESISDMSFIIPVISEQPQYLQIQLLHLLTQRAVGFIPSIKKVEDINEALKFFRTKPVIMTKQTQVEMQKVQEAHKWKFDKEKTEFFEDAPPAVQLQTQSYSKDLKKEIPGPSLTDEVDLTIAGKEQEIQFN